MASSGEPFTGHPGPGVPGVHFATGSLGHGMAYALGWALSRQLQMANGLGIAVVGDGELQEGICWESCQIAPRPARRGFRGRGRLQRRPERRPRR